MVYPAAQEKRIFWAPLAAVGLKDWDAGWLGVYLLCYLPVMVALRRGLRIP